MNCENKSVLTCMNCKYHEQCDRAITCKGQCEACDNAACENNKNNKELKTMKTLKLPYYPDMEFTFQTDTYSQNGNTYVGIICKENGTPEPYCALTVNLNEKLDNDKAYIDVNNGDMCLLRYMEENGFIEYAGKIKPSGFVTYPLYKLNLKKINEYKEV